MQLEWLISGSAPTWVEENYQDGGYVYDTYARNILRTMYPLKVTYFSRGNSKSTVKKATEFLKYLLNSSLIKFAGQVVVRDPFSTVFAPFDRKRKNIIILHHLYTADFKYQPFYKFFERRFFKKAHLADKIVVVSKYWEKVFRNRGCSNIKIIYNSFDLKEFMFSEQELGKTKKELGIVRDKPIIYLGNTRPEKGYLESYNALKEIDANFIASGKNTVDLPIVQKYLSYTDYLKILSLSTIVLTMSKFDEGWCRTAHEAMLCGTPVIGSGRGGMRELLEEGGQIICGNFNELGTVVKGLLNDNARVEEIGAKGMRYASQFNLEYFKKSWIDLISELQ